MKILVTPTSLQPDKNPAALKVLQDFSKNLIFNPTGKPLSEEELIPLLKECDGYIAVLDFVTKKVIDSCPRLKVISRYGAGYDRVDISAAREKGITVTTTPGVNAEAVGELTFGLILCAARKIPYLDQSTKEGGWIRSIGIELKGKTLGIMGLGAIGKVVARCAKGFGMNVIAYDPFINLEYCKNQSIDSMEADQVLTHSNVLCLHLPLNEKTWHLIDEKAISKMPEGAIIINASRGGIIDEAAAYKALKSGKLGGLGLDAFEQEPPENSPLFELPNVIVTPHTGAHTIEAADGMASLSIKNLIDVLSGRKCPFAVT